MSDDIIKLGGNIQLTGFSEVDKSSMIVIKKIVGNYVRKFSDKCRKFENLSLLVKPIHITEGSMIYEMHAKAISEGKPVVGEITERNIFTAVDSALKKIESSLC